MQAVTNKFFQGAKYTPILPLDQLFVILFQVQGYVSPGSEKLDNLKEDSAGDKAVHELREAFDVSSVDAKAPFPDDAVPELRTTMTEILTPLQTLADHLFR